MRKIFHLIQMRVWIVVETDMAQVQTLSLHALSQTERLNQGNP